MADRERVLIAGGGVAGLAAARALHRVGIPVLVLERRAGPGDAGLAINLPGNAIRALAGLGLDEAVRDLGTSVRRREYRTDRDHLLFAIDEDAFWGVEARPRCVRRADLLHLLGDGLPAGNIRRECGVSAVRHDQDGVTVELTDGTVERGGWLIGADGVRSSVRRAVFGESAPGAALLARASWRFMTRNPGINAWTLWTSPRGLFLLIPVDRDEAYGWVAVNGSADTGSDLNAAQAVFETFPALVRDTLKAVLAQPASLHHSPLEEVRIPNWTHGRVLLAGDAAHATAPVWAQGAALALEDAQVLAALLATRSDRSAVGPDYERQRRPRVAHVQAMTDRLSRTARLPGWARRLLLPVLGPRSYRATYGPLRTPVVG